MEQEQFDRVFAKLTERRKEVLTLFLSGAEDDRVADSLHITKNTVRQHIRNLCIAFSLTDDLDSNKTSQRHKLVRLFAKHKPELVAPETAVEEDRAELERDEETTSNPNFVGREQAIMDIDNLVRQGARCICILSPGGVGKTVLAEQYLQQRFQTVVRFDIAKERQNVSSAESLVEEKLRSLGEEPGREFLVSLARLRAKLESDKIGVLVDNLEPALTEGGRFIENHRSYVELLRVLSGSAVRSLTLITSRETVAENLDIEVYPLARLSLEAWQEYFQQKAIDTGTPVFAEIHEGYQGNALAMKILRSRISTDYDNDIADYWTLHHTQEGVVVEQAIDNLIIEQFNRLQNISPTAYQLLYRMGCFRFQDVPTVPREGLLCLLWDVSKNEGVKAIRDLCDRSLVERVNREYKLHPLIRQEAVKRLQDSEEWERANRTAAEFWTDWVKSVETVEDAQQAIEAYHHHILIQDFNLAGLILVEERDNIAQQAEPLGNSFYRLGLLNQMSNYILEVIYKIHQSHILMSCYNIIGDIEWLRGNLDLAINYHKESEKNAEIILSNNNHAVKARMKITRILALGKFNIGLCQLDMLEIRKAKISFSSSFQLVQQFKRDHLDYTDKVEVSFSGFFYSSTEYLLLLGLLESKLGNYNQALEYIHQAQSQLVDVRRNAWVHGYAFLFLGLTYKELKQNKEAMTNYKQALNVAEQLNFPQVKGKAFIGIAELYRVQNNLKTAFRYHIQSIDILEKLGAKCDLAEAYYQLGLTYKETGDIVQSQDYFNRAIALWEKINAPKQIARVRESMNS
ncbi:tetratricopeptide repeat protein [Roseofilum casamattae]|uniref:Tetratricopeptide repeat protein n=1 Tax=Roseofilum casamattae BLCC-M143 TaxID=3022442 RepID=A0ABT7C0C8_9CYAN|nr:tetratricopeptide repeat protein [Roseofilum casamattae]MDJ1184908.1 tetratricopeptide repeat protein [Roseofilum casamattae BLCC-M143]